MVRVPRAICMLAKQAEEVDSGGVSGSKGMMGFINFIFYWKANEFQNFTFSLDMLMHKEQKAITLLTLQSCLAKLKFIRRFIFFVDSS